MMLLLRGGGCVRLLRAALRGCPLCGWWHAAIMRGCCVAVSRRRRLPRHLRSAAPRRRQQARQQVRIHAVAAEQAQVTDARRCHVLQQALQLCRHVGVQHVLAQRRQQLPLLRADRRVHAGGIKCACCGA
jgi:hypothetical protein